jgi:hypothetical protein
MNILEYYKSGGNPEWLPELRQRYKSDYKRWTAILNSIYYTENIRVGREGTRAAVADRIPSSESRPTKRFVNTWLKSQLSHQLFQRGFKAKSIGALLANRPNELLQVDTAFMLKPQHNQHYERGKKPPGFSEKEWSQQLVLQKEDDAELKSLGYKPGEDAIGFFAMVDCLSRRAYAIPVKRLNSEQAREKIIGVLFKQAEKWAKDKGFKRWRINKVISDKGSEFMLNFRNKMMDMNKASVRAGHGNNYRHVFTFEGKSQANGMVERINGTIKRLLKKRLPRLEDGQIDFREWDTHLADVMNIYNNSIHSTIQMSPNSITSQGKTEDPAHSYEVAAHNIRARAMRMKPFVSVKYKAGDFVRLYMYNKSKQRQYPSFTFKDGPLKQMIDDDRFDGVYMIHKVYAGNRSGVGKTTSYGLVANWIKETKVPDPDGGTLPSGVQDVRVQRGIVESIDGSLFDGRRYPRGAFIRKFVAEELLALVKDEKGYPVVNDEKAKPRKLKTAPVKTREMRDGHQTLGEVERVIDVNKNKAKVKTVDGDLKWVSLDKVKNGNAYTKYLRGTANRRVYNLRAKSHYEVERVLSEKNGKVKVSWKGYEAPTWEPVGNIKHTDAYKKYKKK